MSTIEKPRTRRKKLDFGCAGISMTPEEFDAIEEIDDRFRYELIRGVLIVSRYPRMAERSPNEFLGYWLLKYQQEHPEGHCLDFTIPECYVKTGKNRRRPDRVIWIGLGRMPDIEEAYLDLPAVAIEFVSESKRDWLRDYEEKRVEYLALGISEYWIINRFDRTMSVYRQPPTEPAELMIAADGIYRTPLLPGFELPLARLLAISDQWRKTKPKKPKRKPPTAE